MKKNSLRHGLLFCLFLVSVNLANSLKYLSHMQSSWKVAAYFFVHFLLLFCFVYKVYRDLSSKNSFLLKASKKLWSVPIPFGAKIATTIVMGGNIISIIFGISYYPFFDVGMFRSSKDFRGQPKVVYLPKYYY